MLTGFPSDFITAMKSRTRKPVQLAVIRLDSGDMYRLSDAPFTYGGVEWKPWVESWGTIQDNSDVNSLYGGQTLGIRTSNITLIVTAKTRALVAHMLGQGIENTKVELYQWFHGMTSNAQLIDKFVCQDPITIEESSLLFTIDLVSPLMSSNRRLYPVKAGEKHYPVVVGRADGLPMLNLNTGQFALLGEDMRFDQTGLVKFDINKNMPAAGHIIIDEERLYYSSKNATQLNITHRGRSGTTARPHAPGAMCVIVGTSFRYAVAAGPVKTIDNIMSEGVPVLGGIASTGSNPAIVTFSQWPPNIGVAPGRPSVSSGRSIKEAKKASFDIGGLSGSSTFISGIKVSVDATGAHTKTRNAYYITPSVRSTGLYSVNARIKYRIDSLVDIPPVAPDTTVEKSVIRIEFGYSLSSIASISNTITISRLDISESTATMTEANISCGNLTYDQLKGNRWHLCIIITCLKGNGHFTMWKPEFDLSYSTSQVDAPEERVRTFVGEMTCRATALHGANITPPKLIKEYIENHSDTGSMVDVVDFNAEHSRYLAAGYTLNGVYPAGIRVHEAIKEALLQGLGRLKYNRGKIHFLSYFDDDHKTVDAHIPNDDILLRSRSIEHYSSDNIKNYITVKYGYNFYNGDFTYTTAASDAESIAKFTLRDDVRELNLIASAVVAKLHVARMLRFLKDPPKVINLSVFLNAGYVLEKGDKITFEDFLGHHIEGNVLTIERVVGQGKNQQLNLFNIKVSHYQTTRHLVLEDVVLLDDSDLQLPRVFRLHEDVIVDDSKATYYRKNMLELHETVGLDSSTIHFGAHLLLTIPPETVYFEDDEFKYTFCSGYGDCGYGVQPYGD